MARLEQASERMKSLENSLGGLEQQIAALTLQLGELSGAARPEVLRELADQVGLDVSVQARSLILLATVCLAVLLILNATLRRWANRPSK